MALTDEDKQWITSLFRGFEEHFNERLAAVETRVGEQLEKMGEDLRDMETRLLTEFHKWASADGEAAQRSRIISRSAQPGSCIT